MFYKRLQGNFIGTPWIIYLFDYLSFGISMFRNKISKCICAFFSHCATPATYATVYLRRKLT